MPSRVKKTQTKRARPRNEHPELWGLGFVALGLFLGAVLYFGWNGGYVGGWLGDGLQRLVGVATYALPVALVVLGGLMVMRSALVDVRPFRVGVAVLAAGLMITLGKDEGGYAGQALGGAVGVAIGATGSLLLGSVFILAGALLLSGASLGAILRRSGHTLHRAATKARASERRHSFPRRERHDYAHARRSHAAGRRCRGVPRRRRREAAAHARAAAVPPVGAGSARRRGAAALRRRHLRERRLHAARRGRPHASRPSGPTTPTARRRRASPSFSSRHSRTSAIEATVIGQISGPRVTRYELQLAPGTKVAKVAALKDDLSYALATTEIRILAPIPGKQAVGVELPNLSPNLVTLGDIFEPLPPTASPVSVWLGKDISGAAVWTDLARMPHLLIAGTTGSGKSGCLNALLTSVLLRATPDEVRMILIDPKRIELNHYESVPHLLTPVVSSPKEASAVLANCLTEMERRYERLASVRARNITEANRAFRQRGEPTLPYILVVIDELADLMMVAPQAVEDAVIRLAQKSRAVGIHLVLATQRPSVDVITGMIKANVPSRIAFAVSSQTDSRVILDTGGAESLLGQGDMLFKPLGTSRLQRVQGAYVSEEEVALVVEQTRQREQELDESYLELPEVFATTTTRRTTATSTPTTIRCSTRRSRSSSRPRPRPSRSSSAACASATRAPAASSTCSSGAESSPATRARSRAACSSTRASTTRTPPSQTTNRNPLPVRPR